MALSLQQKLLLGFGALAAYLFVAAPKAHAATSLSSGGGGAGPSPTPRPTPSAPLPSGGNVTTPNAGDRLLVATVQAGAAGTLNIRQAAGTQNAIIGQAAHGSTLTATGQVATASDGTSWWQVSNGTITGWSAALFLHDMGPA